MVCAEEVPEQALLNELPGTLKGEMVDFFLRATFQDIDVFRNQRPEVLTMLACCLHPHTTLPGHNLSRQGSRAEKIWILQSGKANEAHIQHHPPPPPQVGVVQIAGPSWASTTIHRQAMRMRPRVCHSARPWSQLARLLGSEALSAASVPRAFIPSIQNAASQRTVWTNWEPSPAAYRILNILCKGSLPSPLASWLLFQPLLNLLPFILPVMRGSLGAFPCVLCCCTCSFAAYSRCACLCAGRIEVLHGLKPLMEIEPPALFGEACLAGDDVPEASRRPFTCRAMSCCMLWQVKPAYPKRRALNVIHADSHAAMLHSSGLDHQHTCSVEE